VSADGAAGQTAERPFELELGSARVAFSTRRGGVSEGPYESLNLGILTDDDPELVSRNRALLAERVGLDPATIAMGWQVHGAELKEWEQADGGFAGRPSGTTPDLDRVDAHATGARGLGLLVLVADCLPVALAAPGRVAMLHCGWRGLAAGIVERVAATFGDERPVAAIGPGIGPCCYEVGDEVRERFRDVDDAARARMLNLRAVARAKLRSADVRLAEDVDLCTSCRPDLFFSHRRDGGVTGRQCGLVWRT
jgi:YfiH family protein